MEKLVTGVAYHGNRILRHVADDMADIARHNMNLVVHTFTHTDWERHLGVMKSIVDLSRENGLDVWIGVSSVKKRSGLSSGRSP